MSTQIETTSSVDFGSRKTGLSTVGFELYASDKTLIQARTTNGVTNLVAGSGIYQVFLSVDSAFIGSIVWDTGDASILYAVQDIDFRKFIAQAVLVTGKPGKGAKEIWTEKEKQRIIKNVNDITLIVKNMKVIDHTLVLESLASKLDSVKGKSQLDFKVISESLELIRTNIKKGDAIKELKKGIEVLSEGLAAIIDNKEVEGVIEGVKEHVIENT